MMANASLYLFRRKIPSRAEKNLVGQQQPIRLHDQRERRENTQIATEQDLAFNSLERLLKKDDRESCSRTKSCWNMKSR